jgi:hypothetical protein
MSVVPWPFPYRGMSPFDDGFLMMAMAMAIRHRGVPAME